MLARVSEQDPEPTQPLGQPWNQPPPQAPQPPQPPLPPPTQYLPQAQPPAPYAQRQPAPYPQQPPAPPYGPPPGYYGQVPMPYGRPMVVAPKSPGVALLASFFIPGLGTMINGEAGKGIGILAGYLVSLLFVLVVIGIFGVIGFWVWGMVDAYQGARKWNLRHGILS